MKKIVTSYVFAAVLTACGGGGGGGDSSSAGSITAAVPSSSSTASQLVVVAKVDGLVAPGYPASGSALPTVALTSGQELEVMSTSTATTVSANLNGIVAALKSTTPSGYKAVLAVRSDTNATLTLTPVLGTALGTSVPVTVKAAQFQPVLPKVGDSFVYSEKGEQRDGTQVVFENTTHRVNLVNSDGSWQESLLNTSNLVLAAVDLNRNGNRTAMLTATSSPKGCNAQGDKNAKFSTEEKLLDFPLFVNKAYNGTWLTTCGTIDSQTESINAKVIGFEAITTSAGTFNALRIDQAIIVANSTNTAYLGRGYTQQASLWFDPILGRMVKYVGQRTFDSPNVSSALLAKTTIELVSYVRQPGAAVNIQPLSPANALLSGIAQPTSGSVSVADTGSYRCSNLTSAQAYSLYLQGHTYLDRDRDGKPCEANDLTIENATYGTSTTSTSSSTTTSPLTSIPSTTGSTSTGSGGRCYVNGYYRSNGTYVQGYYRSC